MISSSVSTVAARPYVEVRGIYGGVPAELLAGGGRLADYGINAVWQRSEAITAADIDLLRGEGAFAFAEFNTMHVASFVAEHLDAAPVGPDGEACPPPDGWQGICPTHAGYRRQRMEAFRALLSEYDLDGVWLDYHHTHASWEQAEPSLPDTCFCARCLTQFQEQTGARLPETRDAAVVARELLGTMNDLWTAWRCRVFTDWVRELREIRDSVRPAALLGTFHCPWTDAERDHAITRKLAIDLRAQSAHIDVFSIMTYHARFGHAGDIDWIARQTAWLGEFLGIRGSESGPAEARGAKRIWPIVQVSDWGEAVPPAEVFAALEAGTRPPSTGITAFNWGSFSRQADKVETLTGFYHAIADV